MRKEFEMTTVQLATLLDSVKPVPYVNFGAGFPSAGQQQENANAAWRELGEELGFVWDTVRGVSGKADRFFTADLVPE